MTTWDVAVQTKNLDGIAAYRADDPHSLDSHVTTHLQFGTSFYGTQKHPPNWNGKHVAEYTGDWNLALYGGSDGHLVADPRSDGVALLRGSSEFYSKGIQGGTPFTAPRDLPHQSVTVDISTPVPAFGGMNGGADGYHPLPDPRTPGTLEVTTPTKASVYLWGGADGHLVEPPAWNDFHTALPTNTGVWSRGVTVTDPSSRIVYSVVTHSLGLRSPTFRPRLLTRIPPRPAPAPPEALGVFPMPAYGGIDIQAISGTVIDMAAPVIVDGKPT